jgi:hypothetical protein
MYVDSSTVTANGKTYTRHLLRESYREDGKVKHRTVANISKASREEIDAIRLALRHKDDLQQLGNLKADVTLGQGVSVGAVWTIYETARQLGIVAALGAARQGKLALWQIIARVIDQGSRLSAVRLAGDHAACDILNLSAFDEDDLYENLDWLCTNQAAIEDRLARANRQDIEPCRKTRLRDASHSPTSEDMGHPPWGQLFLYDVTSFYLEGECNELGAFGYNRDGKKGKRQIVIGLLCNELGRPLSIEAFKGNTTDPATFASQVHKAANRFGGSEVTFVGDRGMIKSHQVEDLVGHGFHYITAITKPQIERLLCEDVLQLELFDQDLAEVSTDEGVRYVLRRNPIRAREVAATRQDKVRSVRAELNRQNTYLADHPRAHVEAALRKIDQRLGKLRLSAWLGVSASGRVLSLVEDAETLAEESKLDGCYVLKTDLGQQAVSKEVVHDRYKDLALVEWAFRSSKTVHLEARPIYVRRESRTRGHVFVVMLAYLIVAELARRWQELDTTVEEGIKVLCTLCATEVLLKGVVRCIQIPRPREPLQQLLAAARISLPDVLPSKGVVVTTKKKLPERRTKH